MANTRSLQSEILISLAAVVVTAGGLLVAFQLKTHEVELERVRGVLGRGLLQEARSPLFGLTAADPGVHWWVVSGGAVSFEKGGESRAIGSEALAMAEEVERGGEAVIEVAGPWKPIRFAALAPAVGGVAVASLDPIVSPGQILSGLVVFVAVFTGLGGYLLRRRVVVPLGRLAWAAQAVADGGPGVRVEVDDVRETAAVAHAFNEMNEALEERTGALEKAVVELRSSNERLRTARDGLDRAERLASVGRLAAGVAHEVGNPMGALLAFLELARRDASLSEEARSHLERAAGQGSRVREILRQMLDFSRPPRPERVEMDLGAVAERTAGLVSAQRRYAEIDLAVEIEASNSHVLADESMVSQILLNLLLNAADVLQGSEAPRLRVRVSPALLRRRAEDGDVSLQGLGRENLDAIECEVADSGPGIAPEDRERIFDPFFTTKPPGEGTGLGLPNAQRLTEELGGVLEVRTSDLGGAAFALRLPRERSDGEGAQRVRSRRA